MTALRTPRSIKGATALLDRFATLDADLALVEAARTEAIASANALADEQAAPLLAEIARIHAALAPWWHDAAAELTKGKRKSAELAGCIVGTRAGRESLQVTGDEAAIVASLETHAWAEPLLTTTTRLNRRAILLSLDGVYSPQLAALGLARARGKETFILERTAQGRTLASLA